VTGATVIRRPLPLFTAAASFVAIACVTLVRTRAFARNPDVVAWGVTFDLTLTIPLLYYIFVVRRGAARPITIAPVFAIGATIAALALPRANQQFLHDLRFLVAPLEVVTTVLVIRRIRSGKAPDNIAFAFVATELSILKYAFAGWHNRTDVPPNARAFTVHRRSGWGSIVAALMLVIASESIAAHLLVQMWSVRAAWLLGDYHALRLRPSFIDGGVLHVRYGLRWSADVALDNIASCEAVRDEAEWKRPRVLKVAMLEAPRYLIRLREPVVARGLAGFRRTIDAIAIAPDDDDALISAVRP